MNNIFNSYSGYFANIESLLEKIDHNPNGEIAAAIELLANEILILKKELSSIKQALSIVNE